MTESNQPLSVDAANTFISSLTPEQRSVALLEFDSPLRPNWSNFPSGIIDFERNGVRIGDLDPAQTGLMREFLKQSLSPDGYEKVIDVVGADGVLAVTDPGAARVMIGSDNYWLAFFGEPSTQSPWAWQFGGHHLAVNITVIGGRSYMSPTHVGVEPATYARKGSTVAPLAKHLKAGLALLNSLDDDARIAAQVNGRPAELWVGADNDGVLPALEGSQASGWSQDQRALLMDTVALWIDILPQASAQPQMEETRQGLGDTYFAWYGEADENAPIYYRIQGPQLIIEFSTQGNIGGAKSHIHSIYRDPANEYGMSALATSEF